MILCELEVFFCGLHCSACYMSNVSGASALGVLFQIYGITPISCSRNVQQVSFLMNTVWLCSNVKSLPSRYLYKQN